MKTTPIEEKTDLVEMLINRKAIAIAEFKGAIEIASQDKHDIESAYEEVLDIFEAAWPEYFDEMKQIFEEDEEL